MADESPTPALGGVNAAQADSAHHESIQDTWTPKSLKALSINGMTPFHSHTEGVNERLREAHALLAILASTYGNADEYSNHPQVEISLATMNFSFAQSALDGVATLLALAQHHYDHVSKMDREKWS